MGKHIKDMFCFKHSFVYFTCLALIFAIYRYNMLDVKLKSANIKLKAIGQTVEEDNSELLLTKVLANLVAVAL